MAKMNFIKGLPIGLSAKIGSESLIWSNLEFKNDAKSFSQISGFFGKVASSFLRISSISSLSS